MVKDANDVLAAWETSSQYWSKHQQVIERMFAPLSRALIEAADIGEGDAVLDVGGGSGEPSLTIAQAVGPTGSVTYTDPAAAWSVARETKLRGVALKTSSFTTLRWKLSFADDSFDAAVGRLSAMFFTDVLAAYAKRCEW